MSFRSRSFTGRLLAYDRMGLIEQVPPTEEEASEQMSTEPAMTEIQGHRAYVGTTSEGEAAVGRIAIWAASVEQNLVHLCARLTNIDDHEIGYAVQLQT